MKSKVIRELPIFENIVYSFVKDDSLKKIKNGFIYYDSLKNHEIKDQVKELKNKGLLGAYNKWFPAPIYFNSPYCIIFFIKKEKRIFTEEEQLLVYTGDASQELSCIGKLYSVLKEEEMNSLIINTDKLTNGMVFVTIKHNKITGL